MVTASMARAIAVRVGPGARVLSRRAPPTAPTKAAVTRARATVIQDGRDSSVPYKFAPVYATVSNVSISCVTVQPKNRALIVAKMPALRAAVNMACARTALAIVRRDSMASFVKIESVLLNAIFTVRASTTCACVTADGWDLRVHCVVVPKAATTTRIVTMVCAPVTRDGVARNVTYGHVPMIATIMVTASMGHAIAVTDGPAMIALKRFVQTIVQTTARVSMENAHVSKAPRVFDGQATIALW